MYMKNSEKEARTTAQNDNGMRRKEGYECSQCGHREDRTHMFKCQSHKMRKERKHGWRLLKKMRRYTNESLLQHIWQGVTAL